MIALIAQAAPPLERIMGIRDRFATGGSAQGFFTVLLLIIIAFLTLLLLAMVARRLRHRRVYNPKSLFLEVLREVPLTIPQRDLVRRMARELRLEHPTVLLLSPQVYNEYANAWMSTSRNANIATRERIDVIARVLYEEAT